MLMKNNAMRMESQEHSSALLNAADGVNAEQVSTAAIVSAQLLKAALLVKQIAENALK